MLNNAINTIALVAGEHSGDNYGAIIINKLKTKYPQAKFIGIGGPKMTQAGLVSLFPMEQLSVVGIFNVIKRLPELIKLKNNLIQQLISHKIDLYIGIDSPDFNLPVAKKIKSISRKKNLNIKTVQYISPTVWAWRPKRIYKVAKATDTVLCIFPFEQEIYQSSNIKADFVGHPLADKLSNRKLEDISLARKKLNISVSNNIIISLYPGSRVGEIKTLAPVFLDTAYRLFKNNNQIKFITPIVSEKIYQAWNEVFYNSDFYKNNSNNNIEEYISIIKLFENNPNNTVNPINSLDIMTASDLILCSSGTTTLEAFLLGVPMVVAYQVSKLNELLIKLLIKVRFIAMPNILADKLLGHPIVPELLQKDVTVDNLYASIIQELDKYYFKTNKEQTSQLITNWQAIQNYIKSSNNQDHGEAILNSILSLYAK